ncbi:MAG: hypothetical protein MUO23_15425 [Anaerolineales bacterium]|nr:hypothetical protein [Anaerolineales bacterium]
MLITRQKLIDLAKRECALQAEQGDVVAGYLTGSVAHGEPLVSGTADIDLVLIHSGSPPRPREVKALSEEIHLDIAHHPASFYAQPRELRIDPWWGPAIAEPVFLYDPSHLFEVAQAGARGQFFRPDNVHARAMAFLEAGQRGLQAARSTPAWRAPFLRAMMEAANAAASLAGAPAAGRRAWLTLERRLLTLEQPALLESLASLLGGSAAHHQLPEWIRGWVMAFDALDGDRPPSLQPARRAYWLGGFQALLEAGRPEAVTWPLLRAWTRTLGALPTPGAEDGHLSAFEASLAVCGLDPLSQPARCHQLEAVLDRVEELLETWAGRNGV